MAQKKELVIVLHGIILSGFHTASLCTYLRKEGFEVINVSYPTRSSTIEGLVEKVHAQIADIISQDRIIHFVGFSLGGLVTRAYLTKYRPKQLGRVVLLATPNHGSEVADKIAHWPAYQWLYGPAGQQLTTNPKNTEHLFGVIDYEVGCIAGNLTLDFISSMYLKGPDDGKVSVASTKLEGMKDHIVVRADHNFFPYMPQVKRHTADFLKNGNFTHNH